MAALTEEQQRIRSYLQAQAARLSVMALVDKVRTDQEQVRVAAEAVPADRFARRPAPGEWSGNEVLAHVVDGAVRVRDAIISVLDRGVTPPALADAIRPDVPVRTAAGWWSELCAARETLFDRVSAAAGDEYPDVTWQHPFFGPPTWREWLLFLRIHDL